MESWCKSPFMKTKPTINSNSRAIDRRLSVAPMMDWTDRFDRYFLRLITRHSLLYTEMITTGALLHGDAQRFLAFDGAEHRSPVSWVGHRPMIWQKPPEWSKVLDMMR